LININTINIINIINIMFFILLKEVGQGFSELVFIPYRDR